MTADRGARLENLLFMHLRAQGLSPEYYITSAGAEIDFVLPAQHGRKRHLIQVCWNLDDPTTRKREIEALRTAMQALQVQHGTVVTWLHEASSDGQIAIVPVWKWLLTEVS